MTTVRSRRSSNLEVASSSRAISAIATAGGGGVVNAIMGKGEVRPATCTHWGLHALASLARSLAHLLTRRRRCGRRRVCRRTALRGYRFIAAAAFSH